MLERVRLEFALLKNARLSSTKSPERAESRRESLTCDGINLYGESRSVDVTDAALPLRLNASRFPRV